MQHETIRWDIFLRNGRFVLGTKITVRTLVIVQLHLKNISSLWYSAAVSFASYSTAVFNLRVLYFTLLLGFSNPVLLQLCFFLLMLGTCLVSFLVYGALWWFDFILLNCYLCVSFLSEMFCSWHDKAMLFEQYHWKKALKKGQPYKFKV